MFDVLGIVFCVLVVFVGVVSYISVFKFCVVWFGWLIWVCLWFGVVVYLVLDWILGFGCGLVWLCGLFCFVVRSALVGLICACLSLVVSFCYVLVLVYCGGLRCLGCDLLVWVCVLVLSGGSCLVCVGWWSAGFVVDLVSVCGLACVRRFAPFSGC